MVAKKRNGKPSTKNSTQLKKYRLDKNSGTGPIEIAKQYVITNWDFKGVYCVNKDSNKRHKLLVEKNITIDSFFVDRDGQKLALYCSGNACMFLVDLKTMAIEKIVIPDSLGFNNGVLTSFYYWQGSTFIVRLDDLISRDYRYFTLRRAERDIVPVTEEQVAALAPIFHTGITRIKQFGNTSGGFSEVTGVVTFFPHANQFTYKDIAKKEIGFVDYERNLHITAAYEGDDVHAIYFAKGSFIVIRCDTIETILDGIKKVVMRADKFCELRWSAYDASSDTLYLMNRYWKGSDQRMTLYCLKM